MQKSFTLLFFFLMSLSLHAQLVITEIMYNPPESGNDSLEYIEIYNNSGSAVDMTGYSFDQGVDFTFPQFIIEGEGYVVVAVDSIALANVLGISNAFQWSSGALSNGGEDIILIDAQSNIVDVVDYENGGDWPSDANGEGASLELCDVNRDNNDGNNWKASNSPKGIVINDREVRATPSADNNVSCADHTVMVFSNFFDPDTIRINVGETVEWICTEGSHNVNGSQNTYPSNPEGFSSGAARPAPWTFSHTFTLEGAYDYRCDPHALLGMDGHVIVENNVPPALVITEIMYNDPGTDSLEFIEIFNNSDIPVQLGGMRLINAVSHEFSDMLLAEQSYIVLAAYKEKVDAAFGINSIQWDDGQLNNSGEAIEILDAQGNSLNRVEYSTDLPWDDRANGTGRSLILCDVNSDNNNGANWSVSTNSTGFFDDGIEIFANPGSADVCENLTEDYPLYPIGLITTVDAGGLVDSIGISCAIQGIVYGVDLQGGNDIQFTLIDQSGGIGVFSNVDFNYTVTEGDELLLKGSVTHFNGLTQLEPDSLRIISTGNSLGNPRPVTELNESTESEFIVIDALLTLMNPADWDESGDSFTATVTDGVNEYALRVDSDTDIAGRPVPTDPFRLTGIGGQFDSSDPWDSGYQILPRYFTDFDFMVNADDLKFESMLVYPNPASDQILILNAKEGLILTLKDIYGRTLCSEQGNTLDISNMASGQYILEMSLEDAISYRQIIKK